MRAVRHTSFCTWNQEIIWFNEVLKGIILDLAPGEVVSLIGGNGSGKSTLMKIIMGIYSADEGEISIDRQKVDISNPKAALAHSIYMVPQEPMLFPNMTVSREHHHWF